MFVLLCIEPAIVLLLVFSNEAHGLFWRLTPIEVESRFSILNRSHGLMYWIHTIYSLTLYLGVLYMLGQMAGRTSRPYRRQIGVLLAAALLPVAGNLAMQYDMVPAFVDVTPIAFTLSSLAIAVPLFRSRVGDIVPMARSVIVESMSDAVLVLDERLRVIDVNLVAAELVGLNAADMIGLPLTEVWFDLPESLILSDVAGGLTEVVLDIGGERHIYDVRLSSVVDWRGFVTGRVLVMRDVTERKRGEELLRIQRDVGAALVAVSELAQAWESLLDISLRIDEFDCGGIYAVDADTGALDLVAYQGISERFAQLVAHYDEDTPQAELAQQGKPIYGSYAGIVPPPDEEILVREGLRSFALVPLFSEGEVVCVLNLATRSREEIPSSARSMVEGIAAHIESAIARARAEGELRRRNRELTMLYEIAHGVSSTLDLQLVLERIATYARDLLEADDSEVYLLEPDGDTLRAVVALGEYAEEMKATPIKLGEGFVGHVAQTGEPVVVADVIQDPRALQIPGTPDESHPLMCVPLTYAGQVMGVMALARVAGNGGFDQADLDFIVGLARHAAIAIENARLFEAEQQRAYELANALEKQRTLDRLKDEFLQNVSHELRSPLALIRGYAEMLDSGELGELQPDQRMPVAVISRRARMLGKLVEDIMLILEAELDPPGLDSVQLDQLARAAVEDFQIAVDGAGLTLETDIQAGLPPVKGVSTYVRRVLDNLIGNALKFTPRGGTISVHVRQLGDEVELRVADTGIGIAPDQQERIFERFYQVDGSSKRRFGGAGLGLALVKEIVAVCHGQILVESQVGEGSTFIVTLPLHTG
jgi:PAS domain S-box-containing protein